MIKSFEQIQKEGFNFEYYEQKRNFYLKFRRKKLLISAAVAFIFIIVGIILLFGRQTSLGIFIIFFSLPIFLGFYIYQVRKTKLNFKKIIFDDLLKKISDKFEYSPGDKKFYEKFRKCSFFKAYSPSKDNDVFKGKMLDLNYDFSFGEILLTSSSGEDSTSTVIFQGYFSFVEVDTKLEYTSVLPNYMEKILGKIAKKLQKFNFLRLGQKAVEFEDDTEFSRNFVVWTKNEDFVKMLLNRQLRAYLLELQAQYRVYLETNVNTIYFALHTDNDFFKINLKLPVTEALLRTYYQEFLKFYFILEKLVSLLMFKLKKDFL
jgi:hypothetical protein